MHPKMETGYTGFGKWAAAIPFLKQLTLSDRKIIQKYTLCLYTIYEGQLYEYTLYETFEYTITRYKSNSVYDNTLRSINTEAKPCFVNTFEESCERLKRKPISNIIRRTKG